MNRFRRYQLRTTDVPAARIFYNSIFGDDITAIQSLPAHAKERGAPAHWLGFIDVENVERAVAAFIEQGAMQLGPTFPNPGGGQSALCRDPGGAVVALSSADTPAVQGKSPDVIWHQLFSSHIDQTAAAYCALLGWQLGQKHSHFEHGTHQEFAWQPGNNSVGSVADVTQHRGVHAHWLFHFRIASLEQALARVREAGGVVIGPTMLDNGDRIAMCEDPQGAAFMLHECAQ